MPRAAKSKISEIVGFFRTCSLEVMDVAKELVEDVVRERKGKSTKAKARAQATQPAAPVAAPVAVPKKRGKKVKVAGARRKPGPKPKMQPLPLDTLSEGAEDAGDASELAAPSTTVGGPSTLTAP